MSARTKGRIRQEDLSNLSLPFALIGCCYLNSRYAFTGLPKPTTTDETRPEFMGPPPPPKKRGHDPKLNMGNLLFSMCSFCHRTGDERKEEYNSQQQSQDKTLSHF